MNRIIRNLTSLSNLNRPNNSRGQVATLLILFMVIALIFVMATVNIGKVAVETTGLTNAADAAALELASSLATKARYISDALRKECGNPKKCCRKTGLAASVFSFIFALIATIATCWSGCWGVWTVLIAMGAGAAGGALGGAYAGTGVGQGAVLGAGIGLAVGLGGLGIMGSPGTLSYTMMGGVVVPEAITGAIAPSLGTAVLGTLGATAGVASQAIADKQWGDYFEKTSKLLNKLKEKDRFRESAFWTALTRVVDDPNMNSDMYDIDNDGNRDEFVSNFFVFMRQRYLNYDMISSQQDFGARNFIRSLRNFRNFAARTYTGRSRRYYSPTTGYTTRRDPGMLEKEEYEWYVENEEDKLRPGTDGSLATLFRGLWNYGYKIVVSIDGVTGNAWEPGPSLGAMEAWFKEDCDEETVMCSPAPAGYDYFDALMEEFRELVPFIDALNADIEETALMWDDWFDMFYENDDPADLGTLYGRFSRFLTILNSTMAQLVSIRDSLPLCVWGYYEDVNNRRLQNVDPAIPCLGCPPPVCPPCTTTPCPPCKTPYCYRSCFMNPPCKQYDSNYSPHTVDPDRYDEFRYAINDLNQLILRISNFLRQIESLNGRIQAYENDPRIQRYGGYNPMTYKWTDSRGEHKVTVTAGPFRVPKTKTEKSGNFLKGKVCMVLKNYEDKDRCWIKVKREDVEAQMGPLGVWNPFKRPLIKRSKAGYGLRNGRFYVELKAW